MVDFDVEYVGHEPGDIERRLSKMDSGGRRRTSNALRKTAEEVKEDLEFTAPVDTGEYKRSWYIVPVAYDEIWILNRAEHAKFVMLPNVKMVGSPSADLPASGVLHDVKGVAKSHSDSLNLNFADELKKMINSLRVKR